MAEQKISKEDCLSHLRAELSHINSKRRWLETAIVLLEESA